MIDFFRGAAQQRAAFEGMARKNAARNSPLLPDGNPNGVQLPAAKAAILREYGKVIGEQQAENIAHHALVAARCAVIEAMEGE